MLTKPAALRRPVTVGVSLMLALIVFCGAACASTSSNPAQVSAWKLSQFAGQPISGDPVAAACVPGTKTCVVFGGEDAYFYKNGKWGKPVLVDADLSPSIISCPKTSFCVGADYSHLVRYNGSAWSAPKVLSSGQGITSVSCASSKFCMASTTSGTISAFRGHGWSKPAAPLSGVGVTQVACATSSLCVAVADNAQNVLSYNGSKWTQEADPSTAEIASLTCVTGGTKCFAIDSAGDLVSYTKGGGWTAPQTVPDLKLVGISCVSDRTCLATASDILHGSTPDVIVKETAGHWGSPSLLPTVNGLTCASARLCLTTTSSERPAVFNGSRLGKPVKIGSDVSISGVACGSVDHCIAWGTKYYGQTGGSWKPIKPSPVGDDSTSCPTAKWCLAISTQKSAVYSSGKWRSPQATGIVDVGGGNESSGVSCPSAGYCVAVTLDGYYDIYSHGKWGGEQPMNDGASYGPNAVSCPTKTFCVAVGQNDEYTFENGAWQAPVTVDPTPSLHGYMASVSCKSTKFCAAVDFDGTAYTFNGTSWKGGNFGQGQSLDSVSCAASTLCVAVDLGGRALVFNGKTWSQLVTLAPYGDLVGVSCPGVSYCVATDRSGNLLTFDHSRSSHASVRVHRERRRATVRRD